MEAQWFTHYATPAYEYIEFAKLRALCAHVQTYLACLCAQVTTCLACLRATMSYVLICSRVHVLMWQHALRANVTTCLANPLTESIYSFFQVELFFCYV